MRQCFVCKKDKEEKEFYSCKKKINKCKACCKQYYEDNKEGYIKIWREKNKEKLKQKAKIYYSIYKDKYSKYTREKNKNLSKEERERKNALSNEARRKRYTDPEYRKIIAAKDKERRNIKREEIKEKRRIRLKIKYREDEVYRLGILLRTGFYKAIKRKSGRKEKSILKLIGCTQDFLKEYIEKQFKPEMTWKNHGQIWEIDHIKPIDSFDLTSLEEQKLCFHYTNLQPLFKTTEIALSFGYENEIGNQNKTNKTF